MTLSPISEQLAKQCYAITSEVISPSLLQDLERDLDQKWEKGLFQAANVGNKNTRLNDPAVRGDFTLWWGEDLTSSQIQLLSFLNELKNELNRSLFLGLNQQEIHYARYPERTFYQKHKDSFQNQNYRVLSFILYLNHYWKSNEGGELVLYSKDNPSECLEVVLPNAGTFVCFLSDTIPHEVKTTFRIRKSITGWIKRSQDLPGLL